MRDGIRPEDGLDDWIYRIQFKIPIGDSKNQNTASFINLSLFTYHFSFLSRYLTTLLVLLILSGCGSDIPQRNTAAAPHGGVLVALENLAYWELVLDAYTAKITAYLLNHDLKTAWPIEQDEIELRVRAEQDAFLVKLKPDLSTGLSQGNSKFLAGFDRLKGTHRFKGVLSTIGIGTRQLTEIEFDYHRLPDCLPENRLRPEGWQRFDLWKLVMGEPSSGRRQLTAPWMPGFSGLAPPHQDERCFPSV